MLCYRLILWALITAYSLNLFRGVTPFVVYRLNQDYIENQLCFNRNQPQIHCKGSCFVKKCVALAVEMEQKAEKKNSSSINSILFSLHLPATVIVLIAPNFSIKGNYFTGIALNYCSRQVLPLRAPPQLLG